MLNQSKVWATVLLVVTFLAGATVGAVGVSALGGRDTRSAQSRTERSDRRPGERGFTGQLTRELSLTPEQRDTVRNILRRYEPAMRAVMESTRPTFDSLRAEIHAEIARVLTAEQRETFRLWSARTDSVARKRRQDQKEKGRER
jgi:Spy/CpxP family protein refolding chaperone